MGCSTTTNVGPKQYAGTATSPCTWQFNCEHTWLGTEVTVTCFGTRTGRPWSQTTTYTTTCSHSDGCAGWTTTSTSTSTVYGIDWGGCDIGGTNCCPSNTLPIPPFNDPSPPPT